MGCKLFDGLVDIFDLEKIGDNEFLGQNLDVGSLAIYGGQVLAQSVIAASATVEGKFIHSLHSYFLLWGDNSKPIRFVVDTIRDGKSFATRRVKAWQGEKNIFILAASFHKEEEGVEHKKSMPNVTRPDNLTPFSEIFAQFAEKFKIKPKGFYSADGPIIFHPVEHFDPFNPGKKKPQTYLWFKPNGVLEDNDVLQRAFMAYTSDFSLLVTALMPHGLSFFNTPMHIASLDHAMWFHRPMDANQWHLYVVDSPNTGGARGFCQGSIYNQEGVLVASVAQRRIDKVDKVILCGRHIFNWDRTYH